MHSYSLRFAGVLRALAVFLGIAFALGFTAVDANAQSASVRGFVTDRADGEALQGVNVVLLDQNGDLLSGTATDQDGLYFIAPIQPGRYTIRVSYVGYESVIDTLDLSPGQILSRNFVIGVAEADLEELVVESERVSGGARVTAGQQSVRPADIEMIPAPDVSGDLVAYLTTMPGVVTTGDRGGQLFIRGGEPSQNLVLLDGIPIYQPFHVLGFYSAFPSDILSRADIYAGGFGSRFGGKISSVLDVSTRNGNKRQFAGAVSVAPFVSSARLEGPLIVDRISLLGSYRKSVIEQGAQHLVDQDLPFDFSDAFGKLHWQVNENAQLSVTGLLTTDRGTIGEASGDTPREEVRWENRALGARYLMLSRTFPMMAEIHLSATQLNTELGSREFPSRESSVSQYGGRVDVTYFSGIGDLNWGLAANFIIPESRLGGLFQNVSSQTDNVGQVSMYLEPDFHIGSHFRVRPGVIAHRFESKPFPFFEPRFRIVWQSGVHEISGAAGVYHQEIVGLTDRRDAASVFTAWTSTPEEGRGDNDLDVRLGNTPRAVHALLGYRVNPTSWLELSVEGFYKDLDNLFISEWTSFPQFSTKLQPADGTARGVDLRVEVRRPRFYGYINYGLSSVRYNAKQAELELWYGTETLEFRPSHDRRHQVNALASTELVGLDWSVRWQFGSGLPFSRAYGFDGFVLMDGPVDVFNTPGFRRVIYERPYNGLLPTYHRLDFSVEKTFDLRRADITLLASLVNVYDRANLFYLDVFTLKRVDQLPLIPTLGVKIEV
ncbi:MAG TPA: TonB-dependent receptor [Rhodothermales bacterium]